MVKIPEKIYKIQWNCLINRKANLFFRSLTDSSNKNFKKVTGIVWNINHIIKSEDGGLFFDVNETKILKKYFLKNDCDELERFKNILTEQIVKLEKTALKIKKKISKNSTKEELKIFFNDYKNAVFNSHIFLVPLPIADQALTKMLLDSLPGKSIEKKQQWLSDLIFPNKENEHIKEECSFYSLAIDYIRKKDISKKIDNHLKKYGWIGAREYEWGDEWKKQDILDRIKFFIQEKDPKKELMNLKRIEEGRKKSAEKLLKKLKIKKNSECYKIIKLACEYAYLRTWRTDIIYRSGVHIKGLFGEMAKKINITLEDVKFLTADEFYNSFINNKSLVNSQTLKKRKKGAAYIFLNGKIIILTGRQSRQLSGYLKGNKKMDQEIAGNTAYHGRVRGAVKKVLVNSDISKVKKGNILVAVMTFPNFVPAMEKAVAFVTDEGGILCHAAIIAREMKKPCIIGTKIATQVLKDGDFVEVDADKGVVRIVKKAKN